MNSMQPISLHDTKCPLAQCPDFMKYLQLVSWQLPLPSRPS